LSGKSESLAKKKYEEKVEQIENFEARTGLCKSPAKARECSLLTLTGEDIAKLNAEQCGEAATDLAAYGIYIQRVLGKERALLNWLEGRINLEIANELNNYEGYYSNIQRRAIALVNNAYAKELEEFRLNSQLKVDMLDGLTYQINQLTKVLLETQRVKHAATYNR
jgi:hypothetical protein